MHSHNIAFAAAATLDLPLQLARNQTPQRTNRDPHVPLAADDTTKSAEFLVVDRGGWPPLVWASLPRRAGADPF